ncbi:MAG: endolytic transglycosylase MltG [Candidatus Andersenbacteria bacterium]
MIQIEQPLRFSLFVIIIVVFILGTSWWLVSGGSVIRHSGEITVAPGDPAQRVWEEMVAQRFTRSTLPWRYYAWRAEAAAAIQAGTYQLEVGESVAAVIERFKRGETLPDELSITYPEGFTLEQMAARTAAKNISSESEFKEKAVPLGYATQFPFLQDIPSARTTLEGYLFPDTYRVFDDDTAHDVITRMLSNFEQKFTDDLRREAAASGRSLDQIVIMASIIEREVISDDDMALVSGVLWKRFDEDIGLDADATIRYALNAWDKALTVTDLALDSPYNTRRYRGLPPGPISNPGLRALAAAVRPEESEYYYYLSAPTGETIFSRTNDEHNVNKAKYLQ